MNAKKLFQYRLKNKMKLKRARREFIIKLQSPLQVLWLNGLTKYIMMIGLDH